MTSILLNILFFLLGVVVTLFALAIVKRNRRRGVAIEPAYQSRIPVSIHSRGTAREAFMANIDSLSPLLRSLESEQPVPSVINDAIIEINNQELMAIWVRIASSPSAVRRILAMWGIKMETEIKFRTLPHHLDRYVTDDGGQPQSGHTYSVTSPCWILTDRDNEGRILQKVILKGKVRKL